MKRIVYSSTNKSFQTFGRNLSFAVKDALPLDLQYDIMNYTGSSTHYIIHLFRGKNSLYDENQAEEVANIAAKVVRSYLPDSNFPNTDFEISIQPTIEGCFEVCIRLEK